MAAILVSLAIAAFSIVIGLWLGLRVSRRSGHQGPRDWTPQQRRMAGVSLGLVLLVTVGVVVAFGTGNPGIGVGILIAVYVLPTLVLTPIRIRRAGRAGRAAEQARAARLGKQGNVERPGAPPQK